MLTISIPTYNRPAQILDAVSRLLPQLDEKCELRVYDNASSTPVAETLAPLLARYPGAPVRVIRNRMNVGMIGNIIRCIEDCPSEWLVMCGDDDPPDPTYVKVTRDAIARYPEAIFLSFALGDEVRPPTFATEGLSAFCSGDYVFGTALSISAEAFRIPPLAPFMSTAYMYANTLAPHIALVMAALRANGGQCGFIRERLAATGEDRSLESWSRIWLTGLSLLLELIPEERDRRAFGDKLVNYMSTQTYLASKCIENARLTGTDNTFLFRSRTALRSLLIDSTGARLKRSLFTRLVRNPELGLKVLRRLDPNKVNPAGFDGSKKDLLGRV